MSARSLTPDPSPTAWARGDVGPLPHPRPLSHCVGEGRYQTLACDAGEGETQKWRTSQSHRSGPGGGDLRRQKIEVPRIAAVDSVQRQPHQKIRSVEIRIPGRLATDLGP